MRSISVVLIAGIMLMACTKKSENKEVIEKPTGQVCYIHFDNKDTVKMTITIQGENVSGELMYKLFEKDRNHGQLKGVLTGDTIIAVYTFESEGLKSVREVAFLRKGMTLLEGFAPMDTTGTRFSSHRDLRFSGIELRQTDCHETIQH